MKKTLALFILLILLTPGLVFARIGVGVGTGKIQVEDKLKPGTIYKLPKLTVINTGEESSDYEVAISHRENQSELRPDKSWFAFSPQKFQLAPGEVQTVSIKLSLPVRIEPGDYFAFVEGHPVVETQSGQTNIGIAAAAKLYFTVIPGSFLEGFYYKLFSLWNFYSPWSQRISAGIAIIFLFLFFKRFFHIEVNFKKSSKTQSVKRKKQKNKEELKTKNE